MSARTSHREVELKFRVDDDFVAPDLTSIAGVATTSGRPPVSMTAVYHDTPTLTLIRWRTTLRRREGGADQGWHLKLPVLGEDGSVRDEIHAPLSAGPVGSVPAGLADIVAPLVRDAELVPMATVHAHRTPTLLVADDGSVVLELVDDRIRIEGPDGSIVGAYRELEVEILAHDHPGAATMLIAVSEALLQSGAQSSSMSKAAEALGPMAAAPPDVPDLNVPAEGGLAVDALRAALASHVRRLLLADVAVRRDLPDSVHQMRVAARRLRSLLRTFGPIVDAEWAAALREELSWLADELGAIRDTEVMQTRLDRHAADLGDPDGGLAHAVIDERLTARLSAARSSALAALRSDRHTWLLDDLVSAVREPKVLDAAFNPTLEVLPQHVRRAWKAFGEAAGALELDAPSERWHQARIKAKRARYAVDSLVAVTGPRVRQFALALAEATDLLGEHQDAAVAQETLRALASGPGVDGVHAFALGRLSAAEHERELIERMRFLDRWPGIVKAARRSGLS